MNTAPGVKSLLPSERVFQESDRSEGFRPSEAFATLRKRIWMILACTIMAIAAAVFMLTRAVPQYQASAEMLLGSQAPDRRTSDLLEARALSDTVIQGELAILRSSALLIRVVRRLELDKDPEFNPALRPEVEPNPIMLAAQSAEDFLRRLLFPPAPAPAPGATEEGEAEASDAVAEAAAAREEMLDGLDGPIGVLRRSVSVRQRGQSFVVRVTVESADPRKAAGIANVMVDEYIAFVSDKRFEAAQRFTAWLERRVADLAQTVEASERAVLSYQAEVDSEVDSADRLDQQMKEMTSMLVQARATLAETEARAVKARELLETEGAVAAASILSAPNLEGYIADLAELRDRSTDAVRRFGEESTQARAIRQETTDLQTVLEVEARQVISDLENSAEVMQINVDALRNSLGELRQITLARSNEQITLNQLERIADANRRLYEDFLSRFKESSEIVNLRNPDAEVISFASPPGAPATPNKKVTLVLSTVAGLFIGVGVAFFLEMLPKRFTTSDDVTRRTGLRVYGNLPRLPSRNGARRVANVLRNEANGLARATRNMARNLELSLGRPVRSTVLVSHAPEPDKTTLAIMLGWAAVRQGRSCVLVDGDIREGVLSSRFRLPRSGAALIDVLYDEASLDEAIHFDPRLGLSILPTSPTNVDPATLFATQRADAVFRDLLAQFDTVIIDAPPLENMADSVDLISQVDAALYVIKSDRTKVAPVLDRLPLFFGMQKEIDGALLTHV